MWLTAFLVLLIFAECVLFLYIPSYIESKFSSIKKRQFLNLQNFENIASGAILSLAFIHMLPEAIVLSSKKNINLCNIFSIVLASIAFLNITDIIYDHDVKSSIHVNNTLPYRSKSNSSNNINDKTDEPNYEVYENENLDLEIRALENEEKNSTYKSNFFFDIFRSSSFYIVFSLFIHSLLEGILMGSLKDKNAITIVGLSMLAHKWAECLIIYKNVVNKVENKILEILYKWSFILSLPLGVFIAIFYFPSSEYIEMIFDSIACGFFLYLSFNMTRDIKITKTNKYFISFSYFLGVCGMSVLMLLINSYENSNTI